MCEQSIKLPIRKKSGNLSNDPRILLSSLVGLQVFQLAVKLAEIFE